MKLSETAHTHIDTTLTVTRLFTDFLTYGDLIRCAPRMASAWRVSRC